MSHSTEAIAWVRLVLELGNLGLTVVLFFLLRASERRHITTKRFQSLEDKVANVATELASVPTRQDLGKIHARLDDVSAQVSRVAGQLDQIGKTTSLVQQTLMKADR